MQILHPRDLVFVRGRRWRIADVRAFEHCELVTLTRAGEGVRRVLTPFDRVEPIERPSRVRLVGRARWRHACRAAIADSRPPGVLRAVAGATLDLLPHQLEPALAIVRGLGSRVLLADDVGLGKTVQAGVLVCELRARAAADRVLVLVPAGLREQWAQELSRRFALAAEVVDFHGVRRQVAMLPVGVNPWATWPIAIASIDYVKRPEVLPAVLSCRWDVLVVDEAHGVASDSDRHDAVQALARQAAYVVLLTATPHSGDTRSFASLCAIGEYDDRLLVFRRSRDTVRPGASRRIHRIAVRPSAAEARMHALLAEFAQAVRRDRGDNDAEVWLALGVLHKRAYSSPHSLEQSVVRRLAALADPGGDAQQLPLPLDDRSGELDGADEAPAWNGALSLGNVARERQMLTALATAARLATARESKLAALQRLLDRLGEPAVIFTEYRDTLLHVASRLRGPAALLHGGMSRHERTQALHEFASGHGTLLVATDAAGEGLNLHHACRIVINLELPWNPVRLEQRIGRVDRIGQQRAVHAFHLIARGTGEERVLERLRARIRRARLEIGLPDPLGDNEQETARVAIDDTKSQPLPAASGRVPLWSVVESASLGPDALVEAGRLSAVRMLLPRGGDETRRLEPDGPLAIASRKQSVRAALAGRVLLVWQVALEDASGSQVESTVVGTAISTAEPVPRRCDRRWLDSLIEAVADDAAQRAVEAALTWRTEAFRIAEAFIATRMRRERAIAACAGDDAASRFQPGLFDKRADRARRAALAIEHDAREIASSRLASLERAGILSCPPPKLLLVLVS